MAPRRGRRGGTTSTSQVDTKRHERAWRAVRAFNEMKPTFTAFARAVTGNNSVTVEMVKGGTRGQSKTDGKNKIYLQPPIALGDQLPHERDLCDERDPDTMVKLCKACATRELLMSRLFHEIAHIAFKSNNRIYSYERDAVRELIREWHPDGVCNHAPAMMAEVARANAHNSLTAAFHPYLQSILKSYEDARIDAKMYRARPGLKIPTEARMRFTFAKGIETDDGTWLRWIDAPIEAQILVGLLLLGIGYDIREEYLAPEVIEHLADYELGRISSAAQVANTVNNAFDISIQAFKRLQEMGLCVVPKCEPAPPPPPSLNKDPEDSDQSDEDGGKGDKEDKTGNGDGSGSKDKEQAGDDKSDKSDTSDSDGGSEPEQGDDSPSDPGDAGDASEQPDSGDGGGAGSGDDVSQDREEEEAAPNSGGSGSNQEDPGADTESDDRDVPADDDRDEPAEQGDPGDAKPDDAADPDGHGDAGDPAEQEPAVEDGEPDADGQGAGESGDPEAGDEEPGSGNDGAGEQDDHGADGEPGEDAGDPASGADGDPGDDEADGSADPAEGMADDSGSDPGDDEAVDESGEGDLEGAEARSPLGEDVWDEENPETIPEPPEPIDPAVIEALLEQFMGHGEEEQIDAELLGEMEPGSDPEEENADLQAVEIAMNQSGVFDTSSAEVRGVLEIEHPHDPFYWGGSYAENDPADFTPSESIIGGALMRARVVFSENKRARTQDHLKSGKINARVLGRRAALGDERLFKKKTLPGKRDYFVVISGDCSGSTAGGHRNERIKRAIFAQAEMLNRLGIPFAVYGHTGGRGNPEVGVYHQHPNRDEMTEVWMLQVKKPNEPWNDTTRQRLADMPPVAENLDGHTLEYLRKVAEKSTATDRIVLYYTDGSMPAANYDEELEVLQTEIANCKRNNITLMAVGINTDSPEEYGFDTVQVDSDEDLEKVVDRLRDRLTK